MKRIIACLIIWVVALVAVAELHRQRIADLEAGVLKLSGHLEETLKITERLVDRLKIHLEGEGLDEETLEEGSEAEEAAGAAPKKPAALDDALSRE